NDCPAMRGSATAFGGDRVGVFFALRGHRSETGSRGYIYLPATPLLLARRGTIFIKRIVSMVIELPRCIASFARGVPVSLEVKILVAVDKRGGTGVNLILSKVCLRTLNVCAVEQGGIIAGRRPINCVPFDAKVFDHAVIPRPEKNRSLIAGHTWTFAIVDAQIPFHKAVVSDVSSAENCDAITLRIVAIVIEDGVARISPIDIKGPAIYTWAVRQKCLVLADHAV